MTEAFSSDYWISPTALYITLNALGKPDYIQANCVSGAYILCYIDTIIGYDNGHNYRRWKLTAVPTKFESYDEKYVYVQIPRDFDKTDAMLVYPSEHIDLYGYNEAGTLIGSEDYYYIYLQARISQSGESGTTARVWLDAEGNTSETCTINYGTLSSDAAIQGATIELKELLRKMFLPVKFEEGVPVEVEDLDEMEAIQANKDFFSLGGLTAYGYEESEEPTGAQYFYELKDVPAEPTEGMAWGYADGKWQQIKVGSDYELTAAKIATALGYTPYNGANLSSWAGSSAITTLGTITTGVWNGSKIADDYIASADAWNAKYDKPSGGISNSDLANSSMTLWGNKVSLGDMTTGDIEFTTSEKGLLFHGTNGKVQIYEVGAAETDYLYLTNANGDYVVNDSGEYIVVKNNISANEDKLRFAIQGKKSDSIDFAWLLDGATTAVARHLWNYDGYKVSGDIMAGGGITAQTGLLHELTITNGTNTVTIEIDDDGNLKIGGNVWSTGGISAYGYQESSAPSVSWSQTLKEGTEIAKITINGVETTVYAPEGGSGVSSYNDLTNKPYINGHELVGGSNSLSTLGIAAANHSHTKSQITDFPSSLPAAGGNADTVDNLHIKTVSSASECTDANTIYIVV